MRFSDGPVLDIPAINSTLGGMYICEVSNRAGVGVDNVTVVIIVEITVQPEDGVGTNGSIVTLSCEAEAFPSPEYLWLRTDGGMIREEVAIDGPMLEFSPVLFGDEGDYYCNATSEEYFALSETATLTGYKSVQHIQE